MDPPATAAEVGPGAVIAGTYRIEQVLGEGGMGLVYEAQHLRVPKRVAIKVLRTTPDHEQLARFRQEAEVATKLRHPGIVDVIDFNTLPSGAAYLVMELLVGENLAERMRAQGRLSVDQALPIIRQIAAALHAAHCAGVVHRDLKPENVFLVKREDDGEMVDAVKLLDFGISKVHGSSVVRTRDDAVLGTPRYMAPEQALGRNDEIDPRSDQFSLGVIAYEMLAGVPPFGGNNSTRVMFQIAHDAPPPLGKLAADAPRSVVDAIERAMSKEPHERFDDLSLFIKALTGKPLAETDRSSYPALAARPPPSAATLPERPSAQRKRRSVPLLVTGIVVLAAGTIAGAVRVLSSRPAAVQPLADAAADARSIDAARDASMPDAAVADAAPLAKHEPPVAHGERLPADVGHDLDDAQAELDAGKLDDADHDVARVNRQTSSLRGGKLAVLIACARHDLASAQARMRPLPRTAWPSLHATCKRYGFELVDPP